MEKLVVETEKVGLSEMKEKALIKTYLSLLAGKINEYYLDDDDVESHVMEVIQELVYARDYFHKKFSAQTDQILAIHYLISNDIRMPHDEKDRRRIRKAVETAEAVYKTLKHRWLKQEEFYRFPLSDEFSEKWKQRTLDTINEFLKTR